MPKKVIIGGLARLEYRGYDSAGIGLSAPGGIQIRKKSGKLANLRADLQDNPLSQAIAGIGHTRWATHGGQQILMPIRIFLPMGNSR